MDIQRDRQRDGYKIDRWMDGWIRIPSIYFILFIIITFVDQDGRTTQNAFPVSCNIVFFSSCRFSSDSSSRFCVSWPIQLCNPDEQQFSSVLFENVVHQSEHEESGIQPITLDSSNISIFPLNTKMFFFISHGNYVNEKSTVEFCNLHSMKINR